MLCDIAVCKKKIKYGKNSERKSSVCTIFNSMPKRLKSKFLKRFHEIGLNHDYFTNKESKICSIVSIY